MHQVFSKIITVTTSFKWENRLGGYLQKWWSQAQFWQLLERCILSLGLLPLSRLNKISLFSISHTLPVLTVAVVFHSFRISLFSQVDLLPKPLIFPQQMACSWALLELSLRKIKQKKKNKSNFLPSGSFLRHSDLHLLKQVEILSEPQISYSASQSYSKSSTDNIDLSQLKFSTVPTFLTIFCIPLCILPHF